MINRRALDLKKKLAAGEFSPGIWMSLPSPTACEVIAGAGLDWILVDAEHSPFNPETLQYMLMAFTGSQTVPIIRVPWHDHVMIKQALDMGWDGVLVPQVNSAEEARRAVAACRYPPVGNRGFGPRRAGNYHRDQDEYVKFANDSVICVIQIEDLAGAAQIDEIIRVPGIDWILVGPCDMSASTGRFLDLENPELWQAVGKVFETAQAAGIPCGNAVDGPENVGQTLDLGCQLVVLGEDTGYLKEAVDNALQVFQQVVNSRGLTST